MVGKARKMPFFRSTADVNSVKMAIKQEKEQDLGDYTEGAENFRSLGYQPEQLPDPDPAGHCSLPSPRRAGAADTGGWGQGCQAALCFKLLQGAFEPEDPFLIAPQQAE